jgi:hypothetical protein
MCTIKFEVQFQHIDARLSKNPELSALAEFLNQRAKVCFADLSFLRHSGNLKFGRRRRNVRIESRAGSSDQIYGNCGRRVFRLGLFDIALHTVQ